MLIVQDGRDGGTDGSWEVWRESVSVRADEEDLTGDIYIKMSIQ